MSCLNNNSNNLDKKLFVLLSCCVLSCGAVFANDTDVISDSAVNELQISENVVIDEQYVKKVEKSVYDYKNSAQYEKALEAADYLLELNQKIQGMESSAAAYSYMLRSALYSDIKLPALAKKDIDAAMLISLKNPNDKDLRNLINTALSVYYFNIEQPYDVIKVLNNIKLKELPSNYDYSDIIMQYVSGYNQIKDFKNADIYLDKYYNYVKKLHGIDNEYILRYYQEQIYFNQNKSDLKSVYDYYLKADNLREKIDKDNQMYLMRTFEAAISYYIDMLDYDKAKKLIDEKCPVLNEDAESYLLLRYIDLNRMINRDDIAKKYEQEYEKKYVKKIDLNSLEEEKAALKNIPDESLLYLDFYSRYSEFYNNNGKPKKAEDELVKALDLIEPIKNDVPAVYAGYLKKTGDLKINHGNNDEGFAYLEKAIEYYKKVYPDNAFIFSEIYRIYAESYKNQGNFEEALKYYNKVLDIYTSFLGLKHRDLAELYVSLAYFYSDYSHKDEAISYIDKAIDIYKGIFGENHIKTKEKMLSKYEIYNNFSMSQDADEVLENILKDGKNGVIVGTSPSFYRNLYLKNASRLAAKKDYDSALIYIEEASKLANTKEQKKDVYRVYSEVYAQSGHKVKAYKYKKLAK